MRFETRRAVFALILVVVFGLSASAQTINGSLSGKVLDASGAVIPNAKVVARNLDTGATREVATDGTGVFRLRALPIGRYSVTFSAAGFETLVRAPIEVQMSVDFTIDATLSPGVQQQVVSITAEAPLIESTQSQLSKGVEPLRILSLPGLNTMNGLALLQAGALPNQNGRPGAGFAVNGGRTRSNSFTIDGANNNDQSLSTPRASLAPEYIEQFRMITNSFSAEYGRNSGSVVSQMTRSGTNEFHGQERWTWEGNGYDSLSTGAKRTFNSFKSQGLDDYTALRKSRAVAVENLGLLSLGGPVKKDRTFFFVGYDVDRFRTTAVPVGVAISPASFNLLRQNQSLFAPGAVDFLAKTFPLANDPTPRGTINVAIPGGSPIPLAIQQYSPGLNAPLSYGSNLWRWLVRSDTKISDKSSLFVRYLIRDTADPGAPTFNPVNRVGQNLRDQSLTGNNTWVVTPSTVNEARVTYVRRSANFPENYPQYFSIAGFTSVGNTSYPQHRTDNGYEFTDNISLLRGRHTIKAGANVYRVSMDSFSPFMLMGSVTYSSMTDFLFDRQSVFQKYTGEPGFISKTWELGAFAQDDFRVTPNFTVNMGIRYEYDTAPFGYWSNAKPDINNFAPRIGFAWRPQVKDGLFKKLLGDKTSIRAGWGMAYDQIFQNVLINVFRNYPRGVNYSYGPYDGKGLFLAANQPKVPTPEEYVKLGFNPAALDTRQFSTDARAAQPYSLQTTFGIERQLYNNYAVKLFYVGTRGVKLIREREMNYGFLASAVNANPATYSGIIGNLKRATIPSVGDAYRIDPTIGGRANGAGIAMSTYHSMQATFEKRYSNGFTFQANYTWSSFINDGDDVLGGTVNNTIPAVPFNFKIEKGRSGLDQPQRLVVNYVYEFPFLKQQKGILGRILGGWQVTGITTLADGTPFTVLNANNALGIIPSSQLSLLNSSQRASINLAGVPGSGTGPGVANPYFIANPANSGIIGNLGRNTQRTGGTNNWDATLGKEFRVHGERHRIGLRWEVWNVMKHRNFTVIPSNTVSNSTNQALFLNLGQQNVGGRTMIFSLRYAF